MYLLITCTVLFYILIKTLLLSADPWIFCTDKSSVHSLNYEKDTDVPDNLDSILQLDLSIQIPSGPVISVMQLEACSAIASWTCLQLIKLLWDKY